MAKKKLIIGTRKSRLALWQAEFVKAALQATDPQLTVELKHIVTRGDKTQAEGKPLPQIGGKGLFTAELEEELREKTIDLAVHSLKDLPTEMDSAFVLGAILEREVVWDALITRSGCSFADLPKGATVGSSSVRRAAQILSVRPDLKIEPIRGNVDTRLAKVKDPSLPFEATVLAQAGLVRLGLEGEITQLFSRAEMLPAPAQGALAVQCRSEDKEVLALLDRIDHKATRAAVTAERAFLATLQAGCNTPVACYAEVKDGQLSFEGRCLSPDGQQRIDLAGDGKFERAAELGNQMAELAIERGFAKLYRP